MSIAPWAEGYVGLPYAVMGRDRAGVDCWGLLRLVWQEVCGITVEGFEAKYRGHAERAVLDALIKGEMPLHRPLLPGTELPLDAVFFRQAGHVSHCGLIVGDGLMLHASAGHLTKIDDYRRGLWARRLFAIYRVKGRE